MRRSDAWSWGVAAAVAGLSLLITGVAAGSAYLWAPYSDPHGWLAALFGAEKAGAAWRVLWRPFNAQRIPLALLAQWLDVEVVRGRAPSFLLMGVLAQLTGLGAVLAVVVRSRPSAGAAAALCASAVLILGGVSTAEDLAYPVFSVYPVAAGFAAAALAALSATPRVGWGGPALLAAIASATLAAGGNAAGLAVWPVLLFWSAAEGRDRRQQAVLWLAAVLVIGAIEWGLGAPAGSGTAVGAPLAARLSKTAQYLAGFAGLWWGSLVHPGPSRVFGVLVLVAAVSGLLRRSEPGSGGDAVRLGRVLASFGLLTAVLAALGRVDELPEPIVPTRYAPFAALLQFGALLCWSGPLTTLGAARPRTAAVLVAALAFAALGAQGKGARALVATSQVIRAGSRAFDAGDRSPAVTRLVDAHPDMDAAVRAELRRRRLPW